MFPTLDPKPSNRPFFLSHRDVQVEGKPFAFKLTHAQGLENITANPTVVTGPAPALDANGEILFSLDAAALLRCVDAAEKNESVCVVYSRRSPANVLFGSSCARVLA